MQDVVRRDRANERRLKSGFRAGSVGESRARYARLMQVDIRHEYYGTGDSLGPCPDFTAFPTPPTQHLMASLGLLFLVEPTGFSVVYDVRNAEGLCSYLRAHGVPPGGGAAAQYWTRLSFVLSLDNPYFVNFTDMPIGTNPNEENFYFTNQQAHRSELEVVLNKGERVDARALLPVAGPEVKVPTPPNVERVVVRDIAGFPVIEAPRCVELPESPPREVCNPFVFLDFRTLPEDKYVIEYEAASAVPPPPPWPILYTAAGPNPLGFIDLLFSRPTGGADGIYPIDLDAPEPAESIQPARYTLRFKARSTYWRYYIVPEPQREGLEDLTIETLSEWSQVPFSGPVEVLIANGQRAYRFVSDERLLLQQRSSYRFRLNGWVLGGLPTGDPLIARMPVAGNQQVLPEGGKDNPELNYSDIYVYV
jgi:hypothetical protein